MFLPILPIALPIPNGKEYRNISLTDENLIYLELIEYCFLRYMNKTNDLKSWNITNAINSLYKALKKSTDNTINENLNMALNML